MLCLDGAAADLYGISAYEPRALANEIDAAFLERLGEGVGCR